MKLPLIAAVALTVLGSTQVSAQQITPSFNNLTYQVHCLNAQGSLWTSVAYSERAKNRLVSRCTSNGAWYIVTVDGAIIPD